MKKLFQAALFLLLPGGMLLAQADAKQNANTTSGDEVTNKAITKSRQMVKELNLNGDQTQSLNLLNVGHERQLNDLNSNSASLSAEDKQKKLDVINYNYNMKLMHILSADEYLQYTKLHPDNK